MIESVSSLSDGQKACLRLVSRGMSSKEIALETRLSPQTVDTYVKQAMAKLGASNRREAARILNEAEASQKSGSPPSPLAETPPAATVTGSTWRRLMRPPPIGGTLHDLGWQDKTVEVMRVAVLGAAVVLALALSFAGLYQIAH